MNITSIIENSGITYACPSCEHGRLSYQWGEIKYKESSSSLINHAKSDGWQLEEYEGIFSIPLKCNMCEHPVFCTGKSYYVITDVVYDDLGCPDLKYEMEIRPQFFTPPLEYIKIPKLCPELVKNTLIESFYIAPISCSSAANRIRVSIEILLDSFNIPKAKNLHSRIELAKKSNSVFAPLEKAMIAIKWIGNEGSHSSIPLEDNHIKSAYRIVSHLLDELYEPESSLKALVSNINTNKGIIK
ncbi:MULTISPECIES: DUF4145 domain-containing protein [unclassified Tatumella]|uniref:DUF4145 domain-containing protein n=1 Tax=unclassified Tatumella TaxID=2649542 RepID=UPI001BAF3295|nr:MULTISPECIES: DUF4145 domain-containing protein [unclassified Tatumella]MBS0878415.1 DUF4145 domain-containing protein [Tatumella sp. JGM82]MBS0891211.1 DUF4145 domain-containing protein [Tatumella sp. JGM94]MBS0902768.1 DUF4145 domain-containing protein [Tatumella sp. JGM100]